MAPFPRLGCPPVQALEMRIAVSGSHSLGKSTVVSDWIAGHRDYLREEEAMAASCRTVQGLGFQGKLCIHPGQIETTNAAFTPSPDEVAYARKIVAAFEEAQAAGSASIQVDGYFVDYPIVEKARRTLALIAAIEAAV